MQAERKRFLFVALTVILTVAVKLLLPAPPYSKMKQDWFWTNKTQSMGKRDIMIYGDSRIYRGIDPAIVEDKNPGLTSFNFGYSSAGFNQKILLDVDSRLSRQKTPAVVLGITPYSLTYETSKNAHYEGLLAEKPLDIKKNLHVYFYLTFFDRYTPSYLLHALTENTEAQRYYMEHKSNGYVKSLETPIDETRAVPSYRKGFENTEFSPEAVDTMLAFVERWVKEGVEVIGFRPPCGEIIRALEDSSCGFNYDEIVVQFRKAGGKWLDVNDRDYKTFDGSHLDYASVRKLSELVGDVVRSELAQKE